MATLFITISTPTLISKSGRKSRSLSAARCGRTSDLGSYKPVGGVMFPFSVAGGPKNDPSSWQNVTYKTIEVNVSLENSDFALPASLKEAPKKQETAKNGACEARPACSRSRINKFTVQ